MIYVYLSIYIEREVYICVHIYIYICTTSRLGDSCDVKRPYGRLSEFEFARLKAKDLDSGSQVWIDSPEMDVSRATPDVTTKPIYVV